MKTEVGVGVALFSGKDGLDARIDRLRDVAGFAGAAIFRPVGWWGDDVAYTRWDTIGAARRAIDAGDAAAFRATAIEPFAVRLDGAPDDHRGELRFDRPGMTVLIVRMAVDPRRCDELVGHLQRFTDRFLPRFSATKAVAFHRSTDRSLIVEVLHVTDALGLARLRIKRELRRHTRAVADIARSEVATLLRLDRIVERG